MLVSSITTAIVLVSFSLVPTVIPADVKLPACFNNISGVYLAKYDDTAFGLIFFFPLGGVLLFTSDEKTTQNQYVSDTNGLYSCEGEGKGQKKLSFNTLSYGQSGNKSIIVSHSTIVCRGAVDDCSDRVVSCSDGLQTSRHYKYQAVDFKTGRFHNPLSPKIKTSFDMRRLETHKTVSTDPNGRDKCYGSIHQGHA
ncbi:unnamed protein product [Didymodactylos carnosus]|uniref:Uncharacterized protein n=1 Tax=Didymodactylos carnosus TaxID=1234261 RepID=A0A814SB38_9BILA|nr:unnamed protein product [Didymodactylos carnosus]CAF3906336.1 unnamed protein product [Didymodactylos carnosus]